MSITSQSYRLVSLLVVFMFFLAGCGGTASAPAESGAAEAPGEKSTVNEAIVETNIAEEPAAGDMDTIVSEDAPAPAAADMSETEEMAAPADDATKKTAAERQQQTTPLRAGEVDDNEQWDDYLLYRRNYAGATVHDRDISERYIIEVQDEQGQPILDAQVRFYVTDQQQQSRLIYESRTYANGQTLFHPLALGISETEADQFLVEVMKDNQQEQFVLNRFNSQATTTFSEQWTVKLATSPQFDTLNLDLVFLIDATGSMDDEIAKIQDTIFDMTAQIDALPGRPNVRYGMVTYRDREDDFVSRTYQFTPNVDQFAENLDTVSAGGGDDYPESLNEGLHKALHNVEWRSRDTIKLIFLIADAPPHLDYAQDYDYAEEMQVAAQQGIKIFPIASSGLDDQGEYIFRQLAQFTQGRFIFLTYADASNRGEPGDVTTHHVDDYSVQNLDDLLVRLVTEELAHQTVSQQ